MKCYLIFNFQHFSFVYYWKVSSTLAVRWVGSVEWSRPCWPRIFRYLLGIWKLWSFPVGVRLSWGSRLCFRLWFWWLFRRRPAVGNEFLILWLWSDWGDVLGCLLRLPVDRTPFIISWVKSPFPLCLCRTLLVLILIPPRRGTECYLIEPQLGI